LAFWPKFGWFFHDLRKSAISTWPNWPESGRNLADLRKRRNKSRQIFNTAMPFAVLIADLFQTKKNRQYGLPFSLPKN
jgi:hypothetical protein